MLMSSLIMRALDRNDVSMEDLGVCFESPKITCKKGSLWYCGLDGENLFRYQNQYIFKDFSENRDLIFKLHIPCSSQKIPLILG